MAWYKYQQVLAKSDAAMFDLQHRPGAAAPHAGIYRCPVCLLEIGIAHGHTLPPQNHHVHPQGQPITWQLLVATHQ